jgi:predicted aspartyl protease
MAKLKPIVKADFTFTNKNTSQKHTVKKFRALVDTGASGVVIPRVGALILEKFIGPLELEEALIQTAGGPVLTPILKNVRVCLDECCSVSDVIVTDDIPADIVVGTQFLKGTKSKIDLHKNTLTCNGTTKKIKMEA